jgi:hypothetical protein
MNDWKYVQYETKPCEFWLELFCFYVAQFTRPAVSEANRYRGFLSSHFFHSSFQSLNLRDVYKLERHFFAVTFRFTLSLVQYRSFVSSALLVTSSIAISREN